MLSQDAKAKHEQYQALVKSNTWEAERMRRQDPGLGAVWARFEQADVKNILIDPDTGRCVCTSSGQPVTAFPGSNPQHLHGVTPPNNTSNPMGAVQAVRIEPNSLTQALRNRGAKISGVAGLADRYGYTMYNHGREVRITVPGGKPVTLTVAQAQEAGYPAEYSRGSLGQTTRSA